MNSAANTAHAARARDAGKLTLPVLFLHGAYDFTCETIDSRLAEPMRRDCADLTEAPTVHSILLQPTTARKPSTTRHSRGPDGCSIEDTASIAGRAW